MDMYLILDQVMCCEQLSILGSMISYNIMQYRSFQFSDRVRRIWITCTDNLGTSMSMFFSIIFLNVIKLASFEQLSAASIAQLGERKTEDLEAPCSIHGRSRYDLSQWKIIITF